MSKIGKTFTIDVSCYLWLQEYAKNLGQKESYVLNTILRNARHELDRWTCPECNESNRLLYTSCHNCSYGHKKGSAMHEKGG